MLPAVVTLMIVPCVAHCNVLSATRHWNNKNNEHANIKNG